MPMILISMMLLLAGQAAQAGDADVTRITHVRVVDGTGRAPVEDATITIRGAKIVSIGPTVAGATGQIVDGTGDTVMPGIINAHGHLGLVDGTQNSADFYTREHVLDELRQYERYGVTTVLSLGLNRDLIYDVRAEQRAGKLDGASVLVADRGIGVLNGAPPLAHAPDQLYTPTTVAEAKKDVDEAAARHTDYIKMWVDDLYGTKPKMEWAIVQGVIAEAHRDHVKVAAHEFTLADAKQLVAAGIDVLAHSVRSEAVDAAFLALAKQHRIYYLPTLTVDESAFAYVDQPEWMAAPFFRGAVSPELYAMLTSDAYREKVKNDPLTPRHIRDFSVDRKNLKLVYDGGVKVGFGTDSGANPFRVPGFAEHHELALMVAAGLTPMQAICAASGTNSQMLGIDKEVGTLVPGHRADLILLNANPLDDIHNSEKIVRIWHGGRVVEPVVGAGQ